jgi:hypothetical protein
LTFYERDIHQYGPEVMNSLKENLENDLGRTIFMAVVSAKANWEHQAKRFYDWIQSLLDCRDYENFMAKCYEADRDPDLQVMLRTCTSDNIFAHMRFAHCIYRFGTHIQATKTIVKAARKLEALRQIDEIRYQTPSFPILKHVRLDRSDLDPNKIVRAASSRSAVEQERNIQAFRRQDVFKKFKKRMAAHGNLKSVGDQFELVVRVHAELQLLHLFGSNNWRFYNNDRYIGCSKGACYFCYQYFSSHYFDEGGEQVRPVVPATHNTVIPGVCVPNPTRFTETMKMKLNSTIKQHIITALNSKNEPILFHPQSTNGPRSGPRSIFSSTITSTLADSDMGYLSE